MGQRRGRRRPALVLWAVASPCRGLAEPPTFVGLGSQPGEQRRGVVRGGAGKTAAMKELARAKEQGEEDERS
jgi:hypothetical protein